MHLADGFLSGPVCAVTAGVATAGVAYAMRRAHREIGDGAAPLMGAVSACIFSAQMVNFPILAGSSGHLMGSALAAITLGPWAATVAMTVVLVVQCFLFGDGGVAALGANVLNMAIVAPWIAAEVYRVGTRAWPGARGQVFGAVAAGWLSVLAAAAACALQFSFSQTYPLDFALPAMLGIHAAIGIVEAAITGMVVVFLLNARPGMLIDSRRGSSYQFSGRMAVAALATALAIAFFLAPIASDRPDGLETVVERLGAPVERAAMFASPLDDYQFPVWSGLWIATSVAGVIGAVAVAAVGWFLGRGLQPRPR